MQSAGRMARRTGPALIAALMVAAPALAQDTTRVGGLEQEQVLTDAQIAAVALAAHQEEIQQSRIALEQTQDEQVREFAQRMIDEHTEFEQEVRELLQQKELEPQESPLSIEYTSDQEMRLDTLRSFTGADFDREYLRQQIAAHSRFLDTLENRLIPSVEDADLRTFLTDRLQTGVQAHLELARERLRAIEGDAADMGEPRD